MDNDTFSVEFLETQEFIYLTSKHLQGVKNKLSIWRGDFLFAKIRKKDYNIKKLSLCCFFNNTFLNVIPSERSESRDLIIYFNKAGAF